MQMSEHAEMFVSYYQTFHFAARFFLVQGSTFFTAGLISHIRSKPNPT